MWAEFVALHARMSRLTIGLTYLSFSPTAIKWLQRDLCSQWRVGRWVITGPVIGVLQAVGLSIMVSASADRISPVHLGTVRAPMVGRGGGTVQAHLPPGLQPWGSTCLLVALLPGQGPGFASSLGGWASNRKPGGGGRGPAGPKEKSPSLVTLLGCMVRWRKVPKLM